jgi:glycosyltransferase involved in cell wall biosynthesis
MKHTLSVVISAYNEEKTIGRCLASVEFADEKIVVDNTSSDRTAEIAKKAGAKVFVQPNRLMLNTNKNYGFGKATGEWILNLDADEEVTPELAREIKRVVDGSADGRAVGYWIARKNIIFGAWVKHGLWWPDKQLRLFVREKGRFPCANIHEYVAVDGPTAELDEPYLHYNYTSVSQYLTKLDRCTTSEALVLKETGYPFTWRDAVRFPVSDFVKIYFAEGGYKDGLHGLVLSLLQAFYSFVTFAKAWEDRGFPAEDIGSPAVAGELAQAASDIRYWVGTAKISDCRSPLGKFMGKVRRKLSMAASKVMP